MSWLLKNNSFFPKKPIMPLSRYVDDLYTEKRNFEVTQTILHALHLWEISKRH